MPNLSAVLGKRFSGNGDFILAGTFETDREIDPGRGPSITAGADFSTASNRIYIEDLGFPDPFMWFLEGAIPSSHRLVNLVKAAGAYLLASLGLGPDRISFEADRLFRRGTTTRFLPYLGMGTDASNGRLKLKGGELDIQWSHRRSRRMFRELEGALKDLSRSLHGKYVTSILWQWPFRKLVTAHPLGGCFMGDSIETGVTNRGEVWGCSNLFVADGSLIPSALSVNPSLTISALAERVAFWLVNGREMEDGDPASPENRH